MKALWLTVVIPAYNEKVNLARGTLELVAGYLVARKYPWEAVIVDDGSTDGTGQLLDDFAGIHQNFRIIHNPHMGKAASVITGALAGKGEIILFTDMDQATPISEADKLLPEFAAGSDIVIGSRSGREGAPFFRKVLALGMVFLRALILRLPFNDTQCGFKAFKAPAARRIFSIMRSAHPLKPISGPAVNPGFDVELLYIGRKLGYRINELPVVWRHQKTERVSFIKDSMNGIRELLLVRWRALTNAYKL